MNPGDKMALADPLPLLLSVDEAAELLRTTRKAVYAMVERSKLGAALGRERMFLNMQAAVDSFENRRAR